MKANGNLQLKYNAGNETLKGKKLMIKIALKEVNNTYKFSCIKTNLKFK
jgi:hypothetical protein